MWGIAAESPGPWSAGCSREDAEEEVEEEEENEGRCAAESDSVTGEKMPSQTPIQHLTPQPYSFSAPLRASPLSSALMCGCSRRISEVCSRSVEAEDPEVSSLALQTNKTRRRLRAEQK